VSVSDRCASPSPGLPAKTFTPPAAPPRSRDRQSRVTRTVIYREISSQPFVFSSSTTTSRHRLSTFSTLASIPAFPERTITIPVRHARGCWRTEQSECLLVFLLSLPLPSPLPFSRPFLSINADGYRVPLIQASSRQRIQGGRRGNALRTRRYVGSTRELCNLVTY